MTELAPPSGVAGQVLAAKPATGWELIRTPSSRAFKGIRYFVQETTLGDASKKVPVYTRDNLASKVGRQELVHTLLGRGRVRKAVQHLICLADSSEQLDGRISRGYLCTSYTPTLCEIRCSLAVRRLFRLRPTELLFGHVLLRS